MQGFLLKLRIGISNKSILNLKNQRLLELEVTLDIQNIFKVQGISYNKAFTGIT